MGSNTKSVHSRGLCSSLVCNIYCPKWKIQWDFHMWQRLNVLVAVIFKRRVLKIKETQGSLGAQLNINCLKTEPPASHDQWPGFNLPMGEKLIYLSQGSSWALLRENGGNTKQTNTSVCRGSCQPRLGQGGMDSWVPDGPFLSFPRLVLMVSVSLHFLQRRIHTLVRNKICQFLATITDLSTYIQAFSGPRYLILPLQLTTSQWEHCFGF